MEQIFWIAIISFLVGGFGSMLGIGGGVLLIPLLTTVFGIPIKTAIAASIISVIATSTAAGAVYVGKGMSHTRLAMVLEIATTAGAVLGGLTAVLLSPNVLAGIFAAVLLYVVYSMGRKQANGDNPGATGQLDTYFEDPKTGKRVTYGVKRLPYGMAASFLAGNISGLLGIGGGVIKVPVMNLMMGMPIRAAIATSNFMIGITAAASAVIYYQQGLVDPSIAVPTALGVLGGAQVGSRLAGRLQSDQLKLIFRLLLLFFAAQMIYRAVVG